MSTEARRSVVDPVVLAGTEDHRLDGPSGEYRTWISIPPGTPPRDGYPLVVLLDANATFATATEIARQGAVRPGATGLGPLVIAGIAYPGEAPYARVRRGLDYTPGPPAREVVDHPTGGRDAFLAFLRGPVASLVARRVPIRAAPRVLVGHSLAGFFTLDVAAHDPGAFSGYVAISPSVWWNPDRLRRAGHDRSARSAVAVGEWEEGLMPWEVDAPGAAAIAERRARRAMVTNARAIASAIGAQFRCYPEQNHGSVFPVAFGHALRFALAQY